MISLLTYWVEERNSSDELFPNSLGFDSFLQVILICGCSLFNSCFVLYMTLLIIGLPMFPGCLAQVVKIWNGLREVPSGKKKKKERKKRLPIKKNNNWFTHVTSFQMPHQFRLRQPITIA